MRIKSLLLSIVLAMSFSFSAYADLKVGVPSFDPPYVYSINEGFAIDLANIICARLKEKCILKSMNYQELFSALRLGQVDWILGSIFIKPSANYIFSIPYMTGNSQFLTLQTNKAQKVSDLTGSTIGVVIDNPDGSVFSDYLNNNFPGQFKIQEFNSMNNLLTALESQAITAAFIRKSVANYWIENGSNAFKCVGKEYEVGQGIGIMSTPAHQALILRINTIIEGIENDNTFITLYNTYFAP